ncbi:MAG: alpha/beta hydrolase [Verrucomicrobiota bacterium]|jgi:pimeloyl-ACP methyl ester carboxylesterase
MSERVEIRVHGPAALPTLVYLPGLHGDWTLIGGFRKALTGRVRFAEMTYPRTLAWSLEDYAAGVEQAVGEQGIERGWLLGESFGSQVVWALAARKRFQTQGVILAGGFARHPMHWGVCLAERLCGSISLGLMTRILFAYARVARLRFRHEPEVLAAISEFIARRTDLDRQAAMHRLHLLAANDPGSLARQIQVPVYALTGFLDPIVPWFLVRPWLKRNCRALREYRILRADHTVLSTASRAAADLVVQWIERGERGA